ncbi:MAG: hypothetical protein DRN15_10635 [Thermoprotei archaeon]|nr:MAG: hypothetical protein DRN15_10635 [Thermoprotei archaeon]
MRKRLEISKEKLEDLYVRQGLSTYQIAEKFGVHTETIRRKLAKHGISRRPAAGVPMELEELEEQSSELKDIPVATYSPPPRDNVYLPLPLSMLEGETLEGKEATLCLVLSDTHFGHEDFLPETYLSTVETLKKVLYAVRKLFKVRAFRVVLNGDIVSGREVYRLQYLANLLPKGHWQVFLAEIMLKDLFESISRIVSLDSIFLIKGTHESQAENYLLYLKRTLKGNGYHAVYSGKSLVLNIADPIGKYNVLFTHGRGRSDYYPVSLSMIRDLWKALNQHKLLKIPIERCCMGHTHWLTVNLELEGLTLDVTGGFQRWKHTESQRPCGMILYLCTESDCVPIPIRPDRKIETWEKRDGALEYKNIQFYGSMLLKHLEEIEEYEEEKSP